MILSESLDITLNCRGDEIRLFLSGSFNNEEAPSIKEKVLKLIEGGSRRFIFDLENVSFVDSEVVPMFITLLNTLKGKGGDLKLIFKNDTVYKSFQPYSNIFSIYSSADALNKGNLFHSLRRTSRSLSRKTGFRISKPLALFMFVILCGWFISLFYIIQMQNKSIHDQQEELHELTHWKEETLIEINQLRERIRPLEQLGILSDTTK